MQGLSTSAHTNWDVVMTPHIVLQETALKLQEFCLLLQPCRLSAEHLVCVGSIALHICLERCVCRRGVRGSESWAAANADKG